MTLMLPANCGAFGNLKDVFLSAEQSMRAEKNVFDLNPVRSALVVMVDGLGYFNLKQNAAQAPFMWSAEQGYQAFCGFPSTTVASITSFATGVPPGEHGLFGYRIFDRSLGEQVNLLSGLDKYQILNYLRAKSVSESTNKRVFAVTRREYAESGMTRATMPAAEHLFAETIEERFNRAKTFLTDTDAALGYLYIPELDQCAHRYGVASQEWKDLLSQLDVALMEFITSTASDVGVLVTADHGIIDIAEEDHIYLDEFTEVSDELVDLAGDPRVPYLYLKSNSLAPQVKQFFESRFEDYFAVLSPEDLVAGGLWTKEMLADDDLLPDLVLISRRKVAVFHRRFSKSKSMEMIGHHGSLTPEETRVPLLRFSGYSSSLLVP